MLIVFRFLSGCAGAAPVAIGAGTIADIIPPQKRGSAIAIYSLGPILGPVLGPIIGGYFAVHYGWRSVFWVLAILVCTAIDWHKLTETDYLEGGGTYTGLLRRSHRDTRKDGAPSKGKRFDPLEGW